jgi:predicted ATPase
MITSMRVSNFRCLGDDVEFSLGRLVVLVGPNGSGKSSVVDVIKFLADILQQGLENALQSRGGISSVRRWGYGRPRNLSIKVCVEGKDGGCGDWEFTIAGDNSEDYRVTTERCSYRPLLGQEVGYLVRGGRWIHGPEGLRPAVASTELALTLVAGDSRLRPLVSQLKGNAVYAIYPEGLRDPGPPDATRPMDRSGRNWGSVLRDVLKNEGARGSLIAALGQLTGTINDCRVRQVGKHLAVQIRHGQVQQRSGKIRERWFEAHQESDGTLRVAGILTALLQEPLPPTLAIEEPELTVHPGVLPMLAEYIKEASTKRCQVIITTHSPNLLDQFSDKHLRVLGASDDGSSHVHRLDSAQKEAVQKRLFSLGELHQIEGLEPGERDTMGSVSVESDAS